MNLLLVFDSIPKHRSFRSAVAHEEARLFEIFPLTADPSVLGGVRKVMGARGISSVREVCSATRVADEVTCLRNEIARWSVHVSEIAVRGRSVKEWMLLHGLSISAWWLGLLAERNTIKSSVFLQMAHVRAIGHILREGGFDRCFISVENPVLRRALCLAVKSSGVQAYCLAVCSKHKNLKERLLGFLPESSVILTTFVIRKVLAWRTLGSLYSRRSGGADCLMATYFPLADEEKMRSGVFENRYFGPVHKKLLELRREIAWLLMAVRLDGRGFRKGLHLAKQFLDHGESMFFIEEFLRWRDMVATVQLWLRQAAIGWWLYRRLQDRIFDEAPMGRELEPLVRKLWKTSYCGGLALEGIALVIAFRGVFNAFPNARDCIYCAEMHAWERALNAAARAKAPSIRTIGYQHTSVPANLFSYHADVAEVRQAGGDLDLPLPSVLAANGDTPREFLERSGYEGMTTLEAVRFLHLNATMSSAPIAKGGRPTLLVVSSGGTAAQEAALLSLVVTAFPEPWPFDLYFRPHPSVLLDRVFRKAGIDPVSGTIRVSSGPIASELSRAWAVVVASSSLAVEALAYGCEVIVPLLPDAILLNPVVDHGGPCHVVRDGDEMAVVWKRIMREGPQYSEDEKRSFVRRYWQLDENIPRWTELMMETRPEVLPEGKLMA